MHRGRPQREVPFGELRGTKHGRTDLTSPGPNLMCRAGPRRGIFLPALRCDGRPAKLPKILVRCSMTFGDGAL